VRCGHLQHFNSALNRQLRELRKESTAQSQAGPNFFFAAFSGILPHPNRSLLVQRVETRLQFLEADLVAEKSFF